LPWLTDDQIVANAKRQFLRSDRALESARRCQRKALEVDVQRPAAPAR
jgi:hypothetical protein